MRAASIATAIVLGALVGVFTASSTVAATPQAVQQTAVASVASPSAIVVTEDNHGNG
ncbi:hypothetical protein ACIQM4_02730 [Streptomyces sp. NPDC091272]|uniref:hypothetical protein n=1 Tax=Streptomyces sp. NPDC091272 TaxID=3365981 RepID=UPI003805D411